MEIAHVVVNGIILVMKCYKYINIPVRNVKLYTSYYRSIGWPIVSVYGNPNIESEYIWDANQYSLIVRAPDSYLQLVIKLAMAIKSLNEIFTIRCGIFRIVDNVHLNDVMCAKFLLARNSNIAEYIGLTTPLNKEIGSMYIDNFMCKYYNQFPADRCFENDLNNYSNFKVVQYASGVAFYLSTTACNALVEYVANANWDVFTMDDVDSIYPLIIEDYAVGYIMNRVNIPFTCHNRMYKNIYQLNKNDNSQIRGYIGYRVPRR